MFFSVEDITLSQLVKCTGLKSRTLQFWTLNGVIHCTAGTEHGGPGVPRRYPEDEVAVALVLSEVIRMPLQIGALREIAERFREIMKYGPEHGVTDPVHWMTSDDGHSMMMKAAELEESRDRDGPIQASKLRSEFWSIGDWCKLQLALRGIRSVVYPGYKRVTVEEHILELAVDDTGRWQLSIHSEGHYRHEETDTEAPPVWSLRLLLNLTRAFTRLPSRSAKSETAAGGEVT